MAERAIPPAVTRWAEIGALVAAGVAAALQFGKVAPSLLAIGADLGIGLGGAAGLLSVFALMAAGFGLPAGLVAARAGVRRVLLAGLWVLGAAGLAAAAAPGPVLLYACRVAEGAAFLAVVVSAPTLVAARAAAADRSLAMTWWSAFMPSGIALGMLMAPLVEGLGWRAAWAVMALLPWAAALAAGVLLPPSAGRPAEGGAGVRVRVAALWRARLPFFVATAFAGYAVVYFGIAGFLPARLVEGFGLSLPLAGLAGAAAALFNIAGNLAAGRLLRRGWQAPALVMAAGAAMTLLSAGTFTLPFSLPLTVAAALLASGIGGVIPASLFSLAPRSVADPALTGPALGLVVQCNNIGSVLAPLAIASMARIDWALAALPLLAAGAALLLLARPLRRIG
ncbi:MFS transporter [Roseomonas sp. SSH11]|uniref:MFS transporter n=1 Tax=Pararoseomonas baculiformis TaxID=2820812 RepID=A0ABS4AFG3_9PROT|nr:MFS transporter [Pararoseomonas baculiformis]MBP0445768.1 MFS transporter [Pararoseomonas baculiformis]